jgi:hypothetical protein
MVAQLPLRMVALSLEVMRKLKYLKVKLMQAFTKMCSKGGADGERIYQFIVS